MEYILLGLSFILIMIGLIGSIIPVLPGATASWVGLLLIYLTKAVEINYWTLGITLFVTIAITILDYVIPAKATKHFGGSKYGVWGTNIGVVVGIIAPIPLGFVIGPFLGAIIGELIYDSKDTSRALKAAIGSFIGFLTSNFIQFIIGIVFTFIYIKIIWNNWSAWF